MKQTKLTLLIPVLLAMIIGAVAYIMIQPESDNKTNSPVEAKPVSKFSFEGLEGWREGPSNEISMALFGSPDQNTPSACFTSAEFKTGTIDSQSKIKEIMTAANITAVETKTITTKLKTTGGDKEYVLNQYKIEGKAGGESLMGGLALGFIQLEDNYIKLEGNCNTFDQLDSTIPALNAYKLNI